MRNSRLWALTGAAALAISCTVAAAWPASGTPGPARSTLRGSLTPAKERSHPAGSVAASSAVSFNLMLTMRDAAGAQALVRQVSTPGSAQFHHYLSLKTWVARYAPTAATVATATQWLRGEGFSVGALPKDRLYIPASGTAAQVEKAFGVTLGYYKVNGHTVRLANGSLTIPAALSGVVTGAVGVNQQIATTGLAVQPAGPAAASGAAAAAAKAAQEPPPPPGFRNAQPCSVKYWGAKVDTKDSGSLYAPYTHPLPYDICGYKPYQLRGAYNISGTTAGGDGTGVAIAIVDAYDSPTLFADAHKYFQKNDSSHPLNASQFFNLAPASVDDVGLCGGSGWYAEQALDVEASHAMAPGADILFVGAQDCLDNSLLSALTTAITSGASVVSDSWGDTLGDVFTDAATKTAYDDTFLVADGTGVSVLFSSGDFGDNFGISGIAAPDYPASSPFITAVGGTTLEVNARNHRAAEYGWSTAKQALCASPTTNCGSATKPAGSLGWQVGGGGGTSYTYLEPYYQGTVVPNALTFRNVAVTGAPMRVVPDISMDGDAQSGMLIGFTQTFPDGTYYDQFKEGGTSLASPLLAGVIADADQKAGIPLGFLNPTLYKAFSTAGTYDDILPPPHPKSTAVIRVDYANSVDNSAGYVISMRVIDYQGPETYCDATGNCATRLVTLSAGPGFDSLTGLGSAGPDFVSELAKF